MSIKNFANKMRTNYIHLSEGRVETNFKASFGKDTSASALDLRIYKDFEWEVRSISFNFSGATARDYSAKVMDGVNVVAGANDYLYFKADTTLWQKITLDSGFYSGTELASELQDKLDANTIFDGLSITFTVTYDNVTGLYEITPSSGNLEYVQTAPIRLRDRDSIAGHLFGLTEDSVLGSSVVSNSPVKGLDNETGIISQTGGTSTEHYNDDIHKLNMDQAIRIKSSSVALDVTGNVSGVVSNVR